MRHIEMLHHLKCKLRLSGSWLAAKCFRLEAVGLHRIEISLIQYKIIFRPSSNWRPTQRRGQAGIWNQKWRTAQEIYQ